MKGLRQIREGLCWLGIYKIKLIKIKGGIKMSFCCLGGKKGFPTFAFLLLVIAVLWILSEVGVITIDIPWFPIILAVIALGWILDHYAK